MGFLDWIGFTALGDMSKKPQIEAEAQRRSRDRARASAYVHKHVYAKALTKGASVIGGPVAKGVARSVNNFIEHVDAKALNSAETSRLQAHTKFQKSIRPSWRVDTPFSSFCTLGPMRPGGVQKVIML